jgi:branched-chain amino acid transport system substrate-binding protein
VFPGYKIGIVEELPAADPMKPVILAYKRAYEARFNEPANIFGAFAHDAFAMLKVAIEQAPEVTRAAVRDALERRPQPFTGASGIYAVSATDHNGFLLDGLVMHEVREQKFTLAR